MKKRPERTSLRAETQATDSTCSGMDREDRRREGAARELAREPREREEQQGARERVEQQVREQEAARVEAVQLEVEHPGEAREREPVRPLLRREGPADALPADPLLELGVAGDVDVVVVVQPLVLADREVDRAGEREDQRAQRDLAGRPASARPRPLARLAPRRHPVGHEARGVEEHAPLPVEDDHARLGQVLRLASGAALRRSCGVEIAARRSPSGDQRGE